MCMLGVYSLDIYGSCKQLSLPLSHSLSLTEKEGGRDREKEREAKREREREREIEKKGERIVIFIFKRNDGRHGTF